MSNQQQPFKSWAVIELFGHSRIAGEVSEFTLGGQSFVRVDVPDLPEQPHPWEKERIQPGIPGHTRLFGAGAIYSMNFVDELAARAVAGMIRHTPLREFSIGDLFKNVAAEHRQRLLAASRDGAEVEEGGEIPL